MTAQRTTSKRRRLIIRYALLSGVIIGATALGFILIREPKQVYRPGEHVEGITAELERTIPPEYPRIQFSEIARQAGLSVNHFPGVRSTQLPEDMGSGAAWGDYDNDGDWDLYVCDIAAPLTASPEEVRNSPGGNRLFRNNGDGTFTDVTAEAGVGFKGVAMAAAWGDYDNDGWVDLIVTSFDRLVLYRNLGNGKFENVTRKAGLEPFRGFWAGASWGDYDRDGWLDLYICGYVKYYFEPELLSKVSTQYAALVPFTLNPSSYEAERNLLFHNQRNGTFVEVARQAGVDNPTGRSLAAAWADFDLDGWPDLYVANDVSDNALFRNLGNGRFEDISHEAWVADYRGAMGLAIGDWDRDTDLDIFITHWIAQENGFFWNLLYSPEQQARQAGHLQFTDIADMMGLGQVALDEIGWATSFWDFDNDGRLDLFAINGSTFQDPDNPRKLIPMRPHLYWQKSSTDGFYEVGAASGEPWNRLFVGRGGAVADFDGDGDEDLVVVNHNGPLLLFRNEGDTQNHWLKVRVERRTHKGAVIGTIVQIRTPDGLQTQHLGVQPSYLSQNAMEAHFGLGKATQVETVRVTFPNGAVRELKNIPADQVVVVRE